MRRPPPKTRAEGWERRGVLVQWLIQFALVGLKVKGLLLWPWWEVTFPTWGAIVLMLVLMWRFGTE